MVQPLLLLLCILYTDEVFVKMLLFTLLSVPCSPPDPGMIFLLIPL